MSAPAINWLLVLVDVLAVTAAGVVAVQPHLAFRLSAMLYAWGESMQEFKRLYALYQQQIPRGRQVWR